jgi:DNA mismatch repair ATPase MutS
LLEALEEASRERSIQPDLFNTISDPQAAETGSETEAFEAAIRNTLHSINPDEMTPREAHDLLYELKRLSKQQA